MDNRIKSVYLQLDAETRTMSDNARAQFLIKAIYTLPKPAESAEIIKVYKTSLGFKRVNEERLCSILDELVIKDAIKKSGNKYSISTSKRRKIEREIEHSQERFDNIIGRFFSGLYTSNEILSDWLRDSMVSFFSSYSNAWMSDLTNHEKAIESKRADIITQIGNRTKQNKYIDQRDKEILSKKFFSFIIDRDPEVSAFLWEYGTSAFSSKLVKETAGADELSLDLLKNCTCILDTNILIDIALEGDERHDSLDALSEIFNELNTKVYTLKITRDEYSNKIASKYSEVKGLTTGSLCRALTRASDQFMRTAGLRGCEDADDFERFFQSLEMVPRSIGENVEISEFPEDDTIIQAIHDSQNDKTLEEEYQTLYTSMHGYPKRQETIAHDLGLIGAASYLSSNSKAFILSDDPTLNQYAKQQNYQEIPFSVRLDTLINVLAIRRGALNGREISFQNVFANVIRNGFAPKSDTFQVADLSYMYEKNIQVASLPEDRVEEIACAINRMRMSDVPEKDVSQALMRYIQGEKIKIKEDYDILKEKYILEQSENEENKKGRETASRKAEGLAYKNAKRVYGWSVFWRIILSLLVLFVFVPGVIYIITSNIPFLNVKGEFETSIIINVISDFIFDAFMVYKVVIPKLYNFIKDKNRIIDELKNKELESI